MNLSSYNAVVTCELECKGDPLSVKVWFKLSVTFNDSAPSSCSMISSMVRVLALSAPASSAAAVLWGAPLHCDPPFAVAGISPFWVDLGLSARGGLRVPIGELVPVGEMAGETEHE